MEVVYRDSKIQTRVTRSLFRHIENRLVALGYSIPVDNFLSDFEPDSSYANAVSQILLSKGFFVEIFNESTSQSRGNKKVPRIVINTERLVNGEIGVGNSPTYTPQMDGTFTKTLFSQQSTNMHISIGIYSNSIEQDRLLNYILNSAIGLMKHLPFLFSEPDSNGVVSPQNPDYNDNFFIRQIAYYQDYDSPEGIIGRQYEYEVSDLFLSSEEVSSHSQIKQIKVTQDVNTTPAEDAVYGDLQL